MKQNITLAMEVEVLKSARVLAAQQGTSVSRLLAGELERLVNDDQQHHRAKQQALAALDRGFHLGGGRIDRNALHER